MYVSKHAAPRLAARHCWALGLLVLIAADILLAYSNHWLWAWAGITCWGLHMGMTQGLLATMVADTAPADLRGSAFGFFNLVSGLTMMVASGLAGLIWDHLGAGQTFIAGAIFSAIALFGLGLRGKAHASNAPSG